MSSEAFIARGEEIRISIREAKDIIRNGKYEAE
jgi:hypothetical protein